MLLLVSLPLGQIGSAMRFTVSFGGVDITGSDEFRYEFLHCDVFARCMGCVLLATQPTLAFSVVVFRAFVHCALGAVSVSACWLLFIAVGRIIV